MGGWHPRWTMEEDLLLTEHPAREAARLLGRTYKAVINRRVRLGIIDDLSKAGAKKRLSPAEVKQVRKALKARKKPRGPSYAEIGSWFGVSSQAISDIDNGRRHANHHVSRVRRSLARAGP